VCLCASSPLTPPVAQTAPFHLVPFRSPSEDYNITLFPLTLQHLNKSLPANSFVWNVSVMLVLPAAVCVCVCVCVLLNSSFFAVDANDYWKMDFRSSSCFLPPSCPVQVLYSDSFRKQVQGKAAFVLDTPEMRRVRETQRIISGVRFSMTFLCYCLSGS